MRFQPKSEDDLKREQLCAPGTYPFTILSAKDRVSSSGKEMIELKLNVHAEDGDYHVYDYISGDFMAHKLRHFAVHCGLAGKYEAGTISAADCEGRQGWCDVGVKDDKQYGPKNTIKDYFQSQAAEPVQVVKPAPKPAPVEETDDVPF